MHPARCRLFSVAAPSSQMQQATDLNSPTLNTPRSRAFEPGRPRQMHTSLYRPSQICRGSIVVLSRRTSKTASQGASSFIADNFWDLLVSP